MPLGPTGLIDGADAQVLVVRPVDMREGEGSVAIGGDRSLREVALRGVLAVGSIILNDEVIGGEAGVGAPC